MTTLNHLKETIYHEFGHILIYILANAKNDTHLGNIKQIVLGEFKNFVSPDINLYYYELTKENLHIYKNSKNIKRTICWIILQFSGCLFESYYDNKDFNKLFCSRWDCHGKKDFDNLLHLRHKSYINLTEKYVNELITEFKNLLIKHNTFEKSNTYLDYFLNIHGESNHFSFDNEDIELIIYEMTEKILTIELQNDFELLINSEENKFY